MKPTIMARLFNRMHRMRSQLHTLLARTTGAEIGRDCEIGRGCEIMLGPASARRGKLLLGDKCVLGTTVILHPHGGSIRLGAHVHLGPHTVIYGHGGITIGDGTLVAMHCRILSSNHTIPSPGIDIRSQPDVLLSTKIGRDVWLGAGVTVLGGVTIGDGCVVGAGAVVTKDLPPGSIAYGIPALVRSMR